MTWVFTVASLTTRPQRDLVVRQAARDQREHLELPRSVSTPAPAARPSPGRSADVLLDQPAGQLGASSASPAATVPIPATSRSGGVALSRNPAAPARSAP